MSATDQTLAPGDMGADFVWFKKYAEPWKKLPDGAPVKIVGLPGSPQAGLVRGYCISSEIAGFNCRGDAYVTVELRCGTRIDVARAHVRRERVGYGVARAEGGAK